MTVYPLCFGQLSVWRYLERVPLELWPLSNVGHLGVLPEGCTLDDVQAAVAGRARNHPSLRTTYDFGGADGPVQILHPEPESVLDVVELKTGDEQEAQERAADLMKLPFTLEQDFGWRAEVMTVEGRPAFLALAAIHMVTDGWSIRRTWAEIEDILWGRAGEAPAPEVTAGPGALAVEQRSPAWEKRRRGARAYWEALGDDFPDLQRAGEESPSAGYRISGTLDLGAAAGAVTTIARRSGVFPQGVVLGLFALGVAGIHGLDPFVMPLMASNRFQPPLNGLITSMNQVVPLGITVDPGERASSFFFRLHRASAKAYRNGSYDVDVMHDLASRLLGDLGHLDFLFNHMGSGWPEPIEAEALADLPSTVPVMGESARSAAAGLYLIVSGHDAMTLSLHADSALYPAAQVDKLLRDVETSLRTLLTHPETTVGELVALAR